MAPSRRAVLKSGITVGIGSGLAGCSSAGTDPDSSNDSTGTSGGDSNSTKSSGGSAAGELNLRMTVPAPEQTTVGQMIASLAETVEEKSEGSITGETFYGDALGNTAAQHEGVRNGTIDITTSGPSFISTFGVSGLEVLDASYLYGDFETALEVMDPGSNVMESFTGQINNEAGFKLISPVPRGTRHITLGSQACTPSALSGKTVRTAGSKAYQSNVEALGAEPVNITSTEIAQALATGSVDGVEQSLAFLALDYIFENQSHLILTTHLKQSLWFITGSDRWKNFSSEQQQLIQESAAEVAQEMLSSVDQREEETIQTIRDNGLAVVGSDGCLNVETFRDAAFEQHRQTYPEYTDTIDAIRDFQ